MRSHRQMLLLLLLMMFSGVAVAQNNTNSPYTRYGYGQLSEQGSGNSRAMGGIAYGLRDKSQVNFANPASYTAVDSVTFIFDGGVSLQNTNLSNGVLKKNAKNSSFDYITMQFRASKWAAISVGLLPYSNVGYGMGEYRDDVENTADASVVSYSGEGGLHQLYLGAGFKIFKNLSVGANISYLWGDITRSSSLSFPSSSANYPIYITSEVSTKSYKLDFGAQYTHQFGKKHVATFGAVFSPGHDLNNDASETRQVGSSSTGITTSTKDTIVTCGIPMSFGAGVTYVYDNRLTVGADVMFQKWNNVSYMNNEDAFCDRGRVSVGAEYIPNLMGRSYLAHVKYRLGAYYSKPYYKIEGVRAVKEYGLTAGFGLPIPRTNSLLSLSAQYVHTKGAETSFLDEKTLRICVGVTFNERWFFKRKVN